MPSKPSVYNQVVAVTQVYLGPATDRFLTRQIENHLNKDPQKITTQDLESLIDWLKLSFSVLTEDSEIVEEYIEELQKISNKPTSKA